MTESLLIDTIYNQLRSLRNDNDNPIFKHVIKGTVPPPDAVRSYPSVAFYIAESTYTEERAYQVVTSEVLFYIYNRHRTVGLDVEDINSDLIKVVRDTVTNKLTDSNILTSSITSSIRDGGSLFPRTIVELTAKIQYVEMKKC